jgi:hypothetical protein
VCIIIYAYLVLPRAGLASKPDKGRVDIHHVMCVTMCSSYWQPSNSTEQASTLTYPRACGTKVLIFNFFCRIMPIEKKERNLAERSKGHTLPRVSLGKSINQSINRVTFCRVLRAHGQYLSVTLYTIHYNYYSNYISYKQTQKGLLQLYLTINSCIKNQLRQKDVRKKEETAHRKCLALYILVYHARNASEMPLD